MMPNSYRATKVTRPTPKLANITTIDNYLARQTIATLIES